MGYYITILLYHYITILLYYYITILLYYHITILLYYYITILLYYYITILRHYDITTLLYYYLTILLYYYITILLYYYITILLYYPMYSAFIPFGQRANSLVRHLAQLRAIQRHPRGFIQIGAGIAPRPQAKAYKTAGGHGGIGRCALGQIAQMGLRGAAVHMTV